MPSGGDLSSKTVNVLCYVQSLCTKIGLTYTPLECHKSSRVLMSNLSGPSVKYELSSGICPCQLVERLAL